ncbi:hypothetical protein KJA16_00155 [Patescibacteria group bacterium]|nr:hypothetical protein [Patescibacteria group bacterium]
MSFKQFLKPDWRKIVLSIIIFLFLFIYGIPWCIDPSEEGWLRRPDPEYWGCHSEWHRQFHFIPDWPIGHLGISFFVSALISYFISCLIIWIYDKIRKKS